MALPKARRNKIPRLSCLAKDNRRCKAAVCLKSPSACSENSGIGPRSFRRQFPSSDVGAAVWFFAMVGYKPARNLADGNFITVCDDQNCHHAAKLRFIPGDQNHRSADHSHDHSVQATGPAGNICDMLEAVARPRTGLKVVAASNRWSLCPALFLDHGSPTR